MTVFLPTVEPDAAGCGLYSHVNARLGRNVIESSNT